MKDEATELAPTPRSTPRPVFDVARQLSVYGVGSLVSLACSIVLLPVYATQLSASQFGLVVTGQVLMAIAMPVVRLGIGTGMFRYLVVQHAQLDGAATDSSVTTALVVTLMVGVVFTVAATTLLSLVGSIITPDERAVGLLIALTITASAPREIGELVLRAEQRAGSFVGLNSFYLIVTTSLTAVLLVPVHTGVVGPFVANLVAATAASTIAIAAIRQHLVPRLLSQESLRRFLRFGVPSIPAIASDWVSQYSDRFFVTHYWGLTQVGIYSMGYRFGMIEQQVLGTAAQWTWDPFVLGQSIQPNGRRVMGRVATYFVIIGMALVLLISSTAAGLLVIAHAKREYLGAVSLIFIIAFANFLGILQHLFSAATSIAVRPELGMAVRLGAAVANVGFNVVLIPRLGIAGAAWATLLTYLLGAVVTDRVSRVLWRIDFEYRVIGLVVVGGLVAQFVIQALIADGTAIGLVMAPVVGMIVYCAWLLLIRAINPGEVHEVIRYVRRQISPSYR